MLVMNKDMNNAAIARVLRQVAAAFEVKDADFFRTKAYQNAASSIEHATQAVKDIWEEGKLDDIPGVGPNLASHLDELFRTGKVRHFEAEVKGLPPGMFALLGIPNIGPKTALKLAKAFKLDDPKTAKKQLFTLAKGGKVQELEGFGVESEKQILESLAADEVKSKAQERLLLPEAEVLAGEVREYLKACPAALEVEVLGSLRRKAATIGDVDLAVKTKKPAEVMAYLKKFPSLSKVLSAGHNTFMFLHKNGRQIDVKTQDPEAWSSMLQHYTGSKLHNITLRKLALRKHLSLSEDGIKVGSKTKTFATEAAFYKYLGLEYIAPEMREDAGEIEAARTGKLPSLVTLEDIKGDLHVHSDIDIKTSHDLGTSSVRELLVKAHSLGYQYLGISDHNPRLRDLSLQKKLELLKRRREHIEHEVSSFEKGVKGKIAVFVGLEVDIRTDGELALEDEGLELLDYVIASVHANFTQAQDEATARVLKALSHPKVRIFGHPTGRKLLHREGLDYDWPAVFEFCAKHGKLLEINATPDRLDLPDMLVREAVKGSVKLVIDTDSHGVLGMEAMHFGVDVARRGWAAKKDITNALSLAEFKRIFEA